MYQPFERSRNAAPPLSAWLGAWLAAAALGLSGGSPAQADTVYRCGPDRNLYSQQPCADGRTIEVDDHRNAEQIKQGRAAAQRHASAERSVARDLHDLKRQRPSFSSLSPHPAASAATRMRHTAGRSSHRKRHGAATGDSTEFTAYDPASLHSSHRNASSSP